VEHRWSEAEEEDRSSAMRETKGERGNRSRCLPRFYDRSPKGSIPDVVYMGIAHRGGTLRQINSRFARAVRAEIYAKPGDSLRLVLRLVSATPPS